MEQKPDEEGEGQKQKRNVTGMLRPVAPTYTKPGMTENTTHTTTTAAVTGGDKEGEGEGDKDEDQERNEKQHHANTATDASDAPQMSKKSNVDNSANSKTDEGNDSFGGGGDSDPSPDMENPTATAEGEDDGPSAAGGDVTGPPDGVGGGDGASGASGAPSGEGGGSTSEPVCESSGRNSQTMDNENDGDKAEGQWDGRPLLVGKEINEFDPELLDQMFPLFGYFLEGEDGSVDVGVDGMSLGEKKSLEMQETYHKRRMLSQQNKNMFQYPLAVAYDLKDGKSKASAEALQLTLATTGDKKRKRQFTRKKTTTQSPNTRKGYGNKPTLLKSEEAPEEFCPKGWIKELWKRQGGATKGTVDRYWYSPKTKKKFRSIVELKRFLDAMEKCGGDEDMAWALFKGKSPATAKM